MITVKGLVISRRDIGENDCIINILTSEYGVMEIYVRGARKLTAKNNSSTQLFAYSTYCINEQNERYYLNSSELIRVFFELRLDVKKYALACYFVEISQYCIPKGETAQNVMQLLLNSLYFLAEDLRSCAYLKCVFEMRFMSEVGLLPQLIGCRDCYKYESEEMYIMIDRACLLCGDDFERRDFEEDYYHIKINNTILHSLRFICLAELKRIFNFKVGEENQRSLNEITEKYILRHLSHRFKALDFYKEICEETSST